MKLFLKDNSDFNIKYNYDNLISFPGQKELLDYFLCYNNVFSEKKIDFKIFNNIYYSDHYPIMLTINEI